MCHTLVIQIQGRKFHFFCQKQGRKQLFVSKKRSDILGEISEMSEITGEKLHNFEQKWPDPYRKNQKVVIFTIGIWKIFFWSPTCWWNLKIAKKIRDILIGGTIQWGLNPAFRFFFKIGLDMCKSRFLNLFLYDTCH